MPSDTWKDTVRNGNDPELQSALQGFLIINLACVLVARAFRKHGRLPKRIRRKIETRIRGLLRKAEQVPKLKLRIYFRESQSHRNDLTGALDRFNGEYTAILVAYDPKDRKNYCCRASLPSPGLHRAVM